MRFLRLALALDGRGISIVFNYDARAVPVPVFKIPRKSLQQRHFTATHCPALRS